MSPALTRPLRAVVLSLGLAAGLGCGDGDGFDEAPSGGDADADSDDHHDDEPVALPCDVREGACQRAVFAATAQLRNQPRAKLPPIRVITRAQFAEETRRSLGSAQPSRRDRIVDGALRMLDFLPPETGSGGAAAEASIEGVAAYYHKGNNAVTIIEDPDGDLLDGTYTLSHEFVHALQDQREDLDTLDAEAKSADASLAFDQGVDGEATVISNALVASLRGRDPVTSVNVVFYDRLLDAFLEEIAESTAPLTHALLTLPYPVGGKPLALAYGSARYPGVARFLDNHPLTYAEWVAGGIDSDDLPRRLGCSVIEPPAGFSIVVNERFGGAGLLALYTRLGLSGPQAFQAARAWTNDAFTIYAPSSQASTTSVLAWRIGLRDAASAEQLALQLRGAGLAVEIAQSGPELLITGSTDAAVLAGWSARQGCRSDKRASATDEPNLPLRPRSDWLR